MKKTVFRFLCAGLILGLVLSFAPRAGAYEIGEAYHFDLSDRIQNRESCRYVEMMLDYYLRNNVGIQNTLKEGYSAVFVFEGCSDNMDDPELMDLTYYRVSAVCIAVKLDENGEPAIAYFNDNCSTLPDRPLEYGAWYIDGVGDVGPATICDGNYELYSVRHSGVYEALNVRTDYGDGTLTAVYMTPEGYVPHRADEINIHTRTGNHTIRGAMWSAGCILVGAGDWSEFTGLMDAVYHTVYDEFSIDRKIGMLIVNRQCLKEELYDLYENEEAVDLLLANSSSEIPAVYLEQCCFAEAFEEPVRVRAVRETQLMSLPCSNETDARSLTVTTLSEGDKVEITRSLTNSRGNCWYEVVFPDRVCYLYAGDAEEAPLTLWERITEFFFG